jgi:hypothetical protein
MFALSTTAQFSSLALGFCFGILSSSSWLDADRLNGGKQKALGNIYRLEGKNLPIGQEIHDETTRWPFLIDVRFAGVIFLAVFIVMGRRTMGNQRQMNHSQIRVIGRDPDSARGDIRCSLALHPNMQ